jgi:hypothetical protein
MEEWKTYWGVLLALGGTLLVILVVFPLLAAFATWWWGLFGMSP